MFPFFLGLSFLLNLRALRAFLTREGEPARLVAWCLAANLVVTYIGYSLKPSMGLGTVAANLPLLFWLWQGQEAARRKAAIIGAGVAVIAVGLWWPERVLASRDKFTQIFLPTMLFTIHADMIHEQIVEDLARHDTAPYPPEWLASFNRGLEQSLTEAQTTDLGGWRSLGFNADHLIYRRSVFDPFFRAATKRPRRRFACIITSARGCTGPAKWLQKSAASSGWCTASVFSGCATGGRGSSTATPGRCSGRCRSTTEIRSRTRRVRRCIPGSSNRGMATLTCGDWKS